MTDALMRYLDIAIPAGIIIAVVRWLYRAAAEHDRREAADEEYRKRHPEAFPELPRSLDEFRRRRMRDGGR